MFFNSVYDCYQKNMFKKREKSIITTFTPKVIIFCLLAYIFKLLLLKIYLCIFLYQNKVF